MKISVLFVLCLSVYAAAGLTLNCAPELSGMVNRGTYDVSVVANEPVLGGGMFAISLTPNGAFSWDTVTEIVADPFSWIYYEDSGVHYWVAQLSDPYPLYPGFTGQAACITFSFPEAVSSFELELLNEAFETIDSRSFIVAPEPATLFILALGAFCLTKKK